nr:MAG: hypothetical protein J07AB56_12640 [Candidatus Nanosalinarum sp. J07AB56]
MIHFIAVNIRISEFHPWWQKLTELDISFPLLLNKVLYLLLAYVGFIEIQSAGGVRKVDVIYPWR